MYTLDIATLGHGVPKNSMHSINQIGKVNNAKHLKNVTSTLNTLSAFICVGVHERVHSWNYDDVFDSCLSNCQCSCVPQIYFLLLQFAL